MNETEKQKIKEESESVFSLITKEALTPYQLSLWVNGTVKDILTSKRAEIEKYFEGLITIYDPQTTLKNILKILEE
jgi:hypothetical protein